MENKPDTKPKATYNSKTQNDEFILELIDLNDGLDLKKSGDRE
jgi:hypothetical protein